MRNALAARRIQSVRSRLGLEAPVLQTEPVEGEVYVLEYLDEYTLLDCGCKRQFIRAGDETFSFKTQQYVNICDHHQRNIDALGLRLRQYYEKNGLNG